MSQMHCPEPPLLLCRSLDYDAMAACQKDDPEIRAYRTTISGLQFEDISFGAQGATLLCDVSIGHPRPIVPAGWIRKVFLFYYIHGLSHPSMRATRKLMATKFI